MDKEIKLQKLEEVLNEYIKYLKVHDKVKVDLVYRTITYDVKIEEYKTSYGDTKERMIITENKIPKTEFIRVTYYECKIPTYEQVFESIEFPWEKIDKRIEHYKGKIERAKKNY
jgi:hypothetical protein